MPVIVHCAQCDKKLKRQPSKARRNQRHFCNRTCQHKWMKENDISDKEKAKSWSPQRRYLWEEATGKKLETEVR